MSKKVFLTVDEVKERGLDSFVLVDVRFSLTCPDFGESQHNEKRPVGAAFMCVSNDLSGPKSPLLGSFPLPEKSDFLALCGRLGIDGTKPILTFDANGGALGACRLWWMLATLGAEAYVLNGGWQAYLEAGLPTEAFQASPPAGRASKAVQFGDGASWDSYITNAEDLSPEKLKNGDSNLAIFDARIQERFESTVRSSGTDSVPGHVHGAYSAPFNKNMSANNMLLPETELKERWESFLAPVGQKQVVCMCAGGVTGCHNVAIMVHLGLSWPRLYVGSWSQYQNLHKADLLKEGIAEHSFVLDMKKPFPLQPLANPGENCKIYVNDELTETFKAPLDKALKQMRLGEHATLLGPEGPVCTVEVRSL